MCIIAFTPAGIDRPSLDSLQNCFDYNDDGAGYAIATGSKLLIRKPFWTWADFTTNYQSDCAAYPGCAMVVHFRIATHGRLTEGNCHPHSLCNGELALAHNGILPREFHPKSKEVSDTVMLCKMLDRAEPGDLLSRRIRRRLSKAIGQANKLVILASSGQFSIVNQKEGLWDNGTWFSNTSYQYCRRTIGRYSTVQANYECYDVQEIEDWLRDGMIGWEDVREMLRDGYILPGDYARLQNIMLDDELDLRLSR